VHDKLRVAGQPYAAWLVQQALTRQSDVIAMRGIGYWEALVPELEGYPHLYRLNRPQKRDHFAKQLPGGVRLRRRSAFADLRRNRSQLIEIEVPYRSTSFMVPLSGATFSETPLHFSIPASTQ
jgi:hypothetical protein